MYGKLLLFLTTLVTYVVLFELIARIFFPLPSPYHLEEARLIKYQRGFWLNQPNQFQQFSNGVDFNNAEFRTDGAGLRNVPCRRQGDKNAPIIYVIGDSQTLGWGLSDQETWVNQFQCLMVEKNIAYNVINMGVPGTNIDQYIVRTKMIHGNLRKQDLVIYVITWNDFHTKQNAIDIKKNIISNLDNTQSCVTKDFEKGEINYPVFCPPPKYKFYNQKTNWRRNLYEATGLLIPSFSSAKEFVDTVVYSSVAANIFVPVAKDLFIKYQDSDTLQKIEPDTFESNNNLIRFANKIVRQKTDNVMFMFLPNRISYVTNLYELYSKGGKVFPDQDFLWHFAKKSCEKNALNCLSLFPSLITDRIGVHEFAHDGHLNETGSRKVALAIFNYISTKFPMNK